MERIKTFEIGKELFGQGFKTANMEALSKKTGIPKRTLYRYKDDPAGMPVGAMILIRRALEVPEDNLIQYLR